MIESLGLEKFYSLSIPKRYILGAHDVSMPEGEEWAFRPRFSPLGEHRFFEVPGSHEIVFTNPVGLADTLIAATCE
jgi:hypothetical protein